MLVFDNLLLPDEDRSATKKLFEMIKTKKVIVEIHRKYLLKDIITAHEDLENRRIIGPAIIIP